MNRILTVNVLFPREVDAVDLRRKLPSAIAVLYRLLRVFVTCTTGLDRSPASVIAYLHWIRDVSLPDAFDFIQSLHPCGPDRSVFHALVDFVFFFVLCVAQSEIIKRMHAFYICSSFEPEIMVLG